MELFVDRATVAVERALAGASERQRVIAHNIANVNTPNFTASRVSFESELSDALANGHPEDALWSVSAAETPVGLDGNNVSLEEETQQLIRTELHYEALTQALTFKFSVLGTAIRGA